jgi:N-acetylglucosaminyl-diphospho-decaprenol L-rhamnosyltransferase
VDKIVVCIINHNTCSHLQNCLQSVVHENPDEIIVVDNASTDRSPDMVVKDYPQVKLVVRSNNLGYGAAANLGVASSQAGTILLLNSDTVLKPGSLEAMRCYLDENQSAAVLGPRLLYPDGRLQTSCFHFPSPVHVYLYLSGLYRMIPILPVIQNHSLQAKPGQAASRVPWVLGAGLALRREAFEAVGGFDVSFFMYFEEVDLCYRLGKAGWEVHYVPAAEVIHIGGASTRQSFSRMKIQYFISLLRFYRKHYSPIRYVQLTLLIKIFALSWWIRDQVLLGIIRDQTRREKLFANSAIWQYLLQGERIGEGAEKDWQWESGS